MDILIDVGGSCIRIQRYEPNGELYSTTETFKSASLEEFYEHIEQAAHGKEIDGISIALSGEYDYANEIAVSCFWNPYLKGVRPSDIKERFGCKVVCIANDGDVHAWAYRARYEKNGESLGGAINLSLGTAVGFGIIDCRGNLLHNCQQHNWEVSCWRLETESPEKDLYWALGTDGLKKLEETLGQPACYIKYGNRLCHFLARDLVQIFHPKFVGLSGGIVAKNQYLLMQGVKEECDRMHYCEPGQPLAGVRIDWFPDKDFVTDGLVYMLRQKRDLDSLLN